MLPRLRLAMMGSWIGPVPRSMVSSPVTADTSAVTWIWIMPPGWEGEMRRTPYVADSAPAFLLGLNNDYVALYHTAGGNIWDEGPSEFCAMLGLDAISYSDLTRRVVDMAIEQRLVGVLEEHAFNGLVCVEHVAVEADAGRRGERSVSLVRMASAITMEMIEEQFPGQFRIEQYFMRDYDEEPAMLTAFNNWVSGFNAMVSFFGKNFDRYRLEDRMCMLGIDSALPVEKH